MKNTIRGRPGPSHRTSEAGAAPHIPGAQAPQFSLPGFWHSLPSLVLKHRGPFCSFFSSLLSADNTPAHTSSAWPLPLPFPGVFKSISGVKPNWRHKRINLIVALLDWLHLGCPSKSPPGLGYGVPLSARQRRVVRTLERLADDSTTFFKLTAELMGRSAAKAEDQHAILASLSRAVSSFEGDTGYFVKSPSAATPLGQQPQPRFDFGRAVSKMPPQDNCTAKPILAERLKFPPAPSFCPRGFLDAKTQLFFDSPLDFEAPLEPPRPVPKVRVRAERHERLALYKALASSGRLKPVCVPPARLHYAGGMFAVPKDLARDRLVLDARPGNTLCEPPAYWSASMASASVLLPIVLEPHEEIRVSSADLKDYFYLFQVSGQRLQKNLLQGALDEEECREVFGKPCREFAEADGRVRVALSTLAMGDSAAVEFAQGSHLGVLYRNGVVNPLELLAPNCPPPRGLLSIGVVLDDLVILERVVSASNTAGSADTCRAEALGPRRLDLAHSAYSAVGLLAHPEKGHRNASEATFWGVKLDGVTGLLRPSPARVGPLMLVTTRVACLGLCTHSLLRSLVGSWTSIFLLRRRTLALMQICFEALTHTEEDDVIRLSSGLRDELWSWVLVSPLCVADLRAPVLEAIYATDASDDRIAAVEADMPTKVAAEVYRFSLQKGTWARLLSDPQAWFKSKQMLDEGSELPGEEAFTPHPVWRVLARSLTYREVFCAKVKVGTHINLKELHAFLRLEQRIGERLSGVRFLSALDSQVALGALAKGRAASASINRCLKRSLGYHLGCNLYCGLGYFRSCENPADDPTREVPLRRAADPLPTWWIALARGRADSFQTWLDGCEELSVPSTRFHPSDLPKKFGAEPLFADASRPPEEPRTRSSWSQVNGLKKRRQKRAARLGVPRHLATLNGGSFAAAFPREWFVPAQGKIDFNLRGGLHWMGRNTGLARRLVRRGLPWMLVIPRGLGKAEESLAYTAALETIAARGFAVFGASPPVRSFSAAVTPPCRSPAHAWGKPGLSHGIRIRVAQDNAAAAALSALLKAFEDNCEGPFWVESPDSAHLWNLPAFARFHAQSEAVCRVDSCRYGAAWRKRLRIATNTELGGARAFCKCSAKHFRLRGRTGPQGSSWTRVADERPARLADEIAVAVTAAWRRRGLPLSASLAKQSSAVIGEASHPGPRRAKYPAGRAGLDLEAQPLLSGISRALGDRAWSSFLVWLSSLVSFSLSEVFSRSPALLAMALRSYGNWLYKTGGTLHELRHAILAGQRQYIGLKPFSSLVWELVSRWEHLEPPAHRVPIPEPLLKALVALAWLTGHRDFAGVALLAFYGLGRIGEVLSTTRSDLLLPKEDLWDQGPHAFLRLRASKTATRGRGKVQHLKIDDEVAVQLVSAAFRHLEPEQKLYSKTPSAFRYRWNKLLELLTVDPALRLTPGGLRGGGAVWCYRAGVGISDIQWRMRLKHQSTLEYYLQEVGAITALNALGDVASRKIRAASATFPFVAAGAANQ